VTALWFWAWAPPAAATQVLRPAMVVDVERFLPKQVVATPSEPAPVSLVAEQVLLPLPLVDQDVLDLARRNANEERGRQAAQRRDELLAAIRKYRNRSPFWIAERIQSDPATAITYLKKGKRRPLTVDAVRKKIDKLRK
jgi:hypothetical protein